MVVLFTLLVQIAAAQTPGDSFEAVGRTTRDSGENAEHVMLENARAHCGLIGRAVQISPTVVTYWPRSYPVGTQARAEFVCVRIGQPDPTVSN